MAALGPRSTRTTHTRRYAAALVGALALALSAPAPLLAPASATGGTTTASTAASTAAPTARPAARAAAPRKRTYTNPLAPRIPSGGTVDSCADPTVLHGQWAGDRHWYLYCTTDPLNDRDVVEPTAARRAPQPRSEADHRSARVEAAGPALRFHP